MTDVVKTTTAPVEPLSVTVIGTGDGSPLVGTVGKTPGSMADIKITAVISPLVAILVRFLNQFLTTLVGLVGAAMTPAGADVLRADDFMGLVMTCAGLSVAGAGFGLLKDLVTVFGKLEGKYPLLTGGV